MINTYISLRIALYILNFLVQPFITLWLGEKYILDENVLKQLEAAEGKRVKLSYKERFRSMPWQGDTNYFIVAVEVIDP